MRILIILLVLVSSILIDLTTKELVIQNRPQLQGASYLSGLIRIKYAENRGLFFSLGDKLPEPTRFMIFTLLAAVVLTGLLIYLLYRQDIPLFPSAAAAMAIGGGMSNVIDRLLHDGAVIDFVYLNLFGGRTDIFNFADIYILVGVLGLSAYATLTKRAKL